MDSSVIMFSKIHCCITDIFDLMSVANVRVLEAMPPSQQTQVLESLQHIFAKGF